MRRLISTDFHIGTPPSLVDELPEAYRNQFPHLERRADGTYFSYPHDGQASAMSAARDAVKIEDEGQLPVSR